MAHEIIVSIFWDANAHCYLQAVWLSKFLPSPKYCIAVSINIDVEIEELCRAGQDALQSALNMISCLDRGCKMPQRCNRAVR